VLTYMATLEDVLTAVVLTAFELPDWEPRQPVRPLWVTPELLSWADAKPELHDMAFAVGARTLFEHLLTMFCDFRCAEHCPAHAGDLKRMTPTKHGIWKMHPPKVRVYGWCPGTYQFIAVTAALESETKNDRILNDKKLKEVRDFIKKHGLENTVLRGDILAVFPN
jgi:hypothetical protein